MDTKETERVAMEEYEECGVGELLARMRQEKHRLSDEAVGAGNERGSARLEKEMSELRAQWGGELSLMPIQEAHALLVSNLVEINKLHAHTEWGVGRAVLTIKGLQGALAYVAAHLESIADESSANAPAPTEEDDDDDDDDDEGDFHAPAVREIVAAYRQTAMRQRDLLLARMRNAAARLGAEAACFASWDPNEHLNNDFGRFIARAEFCLRGICPLEAQTWLESNAGVVEGLHARNRSEYDQARLVLSGLNDRLFGLIYEIAREK